jgi:hypothetical protein
MAEHEEPRRPRPAVLDRLAGASIALAVAVTIITVVIVATDFFGPYAAILGMVLWVGTIALAIAAVVIATVGLAASTVIDRVLVGWDLRGIAITYGAVGLLLGAGIALALAGLDAYALVVFPRAGAAAGVAGCLAAYRLSPQGRRRALTAGAVQVSYVLVLFVLWPLLLAISS